MKIRVTSAAIRRRPHRRQRWESADPQTFRFGPTTETSEIGRVSFLMLLAVMRIECNVGLMKASLLTGLGQ